MKLITRNSKDKKSNKNIYGYQIDTDKHKSLSNPMEENNDLFLLRGLKLSSIELMKSPDGKTDALVFTYKNGTTTEKRIKELETVRGSKDFEDDSKIISSLEVLLAKKNVRKINLFDFMEEIKTNFESDIRYAYKKFDTIATKNIRHSVYIYHIYALIIATVSLINEIDYQPPVHMVLVTKNNSIHLSFKSRSKRYIGISSRLKLINIQGTEMRLEYIGALCREDDISNTLKITDDSLDIEYVFAPIKKEGALYADSLEDKIFFKEYMDIFNPIMNTEEELEEEE